MIERLAALHGRAILIALMSLDVLVTLSVAFHKYRYFLYDDIDLAIFTQATAGILRGSMFSSIRGMAWLGDHSSLVLFLIAPIFALARHPMTLVVVQTLALAAGTWPVYALARRELPGRGRFDVCRHGFGLAHQHLPEQIALVHEVVIQGATGDSGGNGNLGRRGFAIALADEQGARRVDQRKAGGFRAFAVGSGRRVGDCFWHLHTGCL